MRAQFLLMTSSYNTFPTEFLYYSTMDPTENKTKYKTNIAYQLQDQPNLNLK